MAGYLAGNMLAGAVGLTLVMAATVKIRNRWAFVAAVRTWAPMSLGTARALGTTIPWVELIVGLAALGTIAFPAGRDVSRGAAALLFAAFAVAQIEMMRRRHEAKCGCFGAQSAIGWSSLAIVSVLL